jgi:rRNA maturation RNase YbeY
LNIKRLFDTFLRNLEINYFTKRGLLSGRYAYTELKRDAGFLSGLVLKNESTLVGSISFLFCGDAEIRRMNNQYLSHDYATDIITFRYDETDESDCDIIISADTVETNSVLYKCGFEEEMRRVVIHGLLHICGFDDKTKHQKKQMKTKENFYLNLFVTLR